MLADPGHRQIGEYLLPIGQLLELNRGLSRRYQIVETEHNALRLSRRARGVKEDRGAVAAAARYLSCEKIWVFTRISPAGFDDEVVRLKIRLIVTTQTAPIGKDHGCETRAAFFDLNKLVHLLLILGQRETDFGVVQDVGHLIGDCVLIDRDRNAADRLRGCNRPIKPRPVVTDDCELVAAFEAERLHATGER